MLLRVQLPLTAAHGSDEGSPLPAAVLGEQEGDVTFGGKFLHCQLEDPTEAVGRGQQETVVRNTEIKTANCSHSSFTTRMSSKVIQGLFQEERS